MQPYFFPYIGYFQLIAAVDRFVLYDNIKYTKKGWINRNRMLQNGKSATFTLPLKGASDSLDVRERELAADFDPDKLLKKFEGAYRRAPCFEQTFPLIEQVLRSPERNLFRFLNNSIARTCAYLGIETKVMISSAIDIDHGSAKQDKVLALCKSLGATTYVNPIGGLELYSAEEFQKNGIELKFIRARPIEYAQFGGAFVPWLSIVDVMMFNAKEKISACIADSLNTV